MFARCTYLPLSGEVSVTRRNADYECIEGGECVGIDDGVVGLRGSMEQVEDILGESLGNSEIIIDKAVAQIS